MGKTKDLSDLVSIQYSKPFSNVLNSSMQIPFSTESKNGLLHLGFDSWGLRAGLCFGLRTWAF